MRVPNPTKSTKKRTTKPQTVEPEQLGKVAPGATTASSEVPLVHVPVTVQVGDLKPHSQNYRNHPEDQLLHIVESIKEHGFYRNVVVAADNTILAGHGSVQAARMAGLKEIPVVRLALNAYDPIALKILIGDNEIPKLAEVDDRTLTDLLKTIGDVSIDGLLGTGFDGNMLAALVFNTRPASELEKFDDAAEWVGMPEYNRELSHSNLIRLLITFENETTRDEFIAKYGFVIFKTVGNMMCAPWPPCKMDDIKAIRFESIGAQDDA